MPVGSSKYRTLKRGSSVTCCSTCYFRMILNAYRIIDAKFYRQTLGKFFDTEKVHSSNLYQMTSYLMNAPAVSGIEAEGMLIYPKVDRVMRERYDILGRKISVCTVNLDAPWWAIDEEIRALMG